MNKKNKSNNQKNTPLNNHETNHKHIGLARQFPPITAPYCIALEKSVGAIIFRERELEGQKTREFLLMQYPHGHWEFPRGHVEPGEDDEFTTMYREVEEETGMAKEGLEVIEGFRGGFSFSYRARGDEKRDRIKEKKCLFIRKKVIFFLVRTISDEIKLSDEHQKFAWLSLEDSIDRLTFTNAKKMIMKANDTLRKQDEKNL